MTILLWTLLGAALEVAFGIFVGKFIVFGMGTTSPEPSAEVLR